MPSQPAHPRHRTHGAAFHRATSAYLTLPPTANGCRRSRSPVAVRHETPYDACSC
jgi:hypothetical protein